MGRGISWGFEPLYPDFEWGYAVSRWPKGKEHKRHSQGLFGYTRDRGSWRGKSSTLDIHMTTEELLELLGKAEAGAFGLAAQSSDEEREAWLKVSRLIFTAMDFIEPKWRCGCDRCYEYYKEIEDFLERHKGLPG